MALLKGKDIMSITREDVPRWYVVHTYSGYENKVATNLEKIVENRNLGNVIFEVKVPLETPEMAAEEAASAEKTLDEAEEALGPKKKVKRVNEKKLFPSYVLIKMLMNDETWHIVRNTTGVTGFVGPGSRPVALTDEEVEKLGVDVKIIEIAYSVGDSVTICEGPLAGFIGIVDGISEDKKKVSVTASLFGRETKVELESDQVKPVSD